jgi:hypothetical protein
VSKPRRMGSHRFLAAWAEREQRRFEQQKTNPRVPGTEPTGLRILQGFFGTFTMAVKGLLLPLYVVWTVKLITQHTVQSLVLAVAIVMLFSLSVFTTAHTVHTRREQGRDWFTGLTPKVESN